MASVSKSAVPASVSSIRELKNTVPAIDFHGVFERRANIVSLSSFLLAFFLSFFVSLSFLVSFFPLGCSFTAVFLYFCLSFFPLGCNFTAVFRSCCLSLLLSFSSACDHSFVFLSVFRVAWFVTMRT